MQQIVRIWVWAILLVWTSTGWAKSSEFFGDRLKVTSDAVFYEYGGGDLPTQTKEMESWLTNLNKTEELVDNKPSYIMAAEIKNSGLNNQLLVEFNGSIIDEIEAYVYDDEGLVHYDVNGYFYPRSSQSYVFVLPVAKGETVKILFLIQSRYFSGPFNVYLENPLDYESRSNNFFAVVYMCLGGMLLLGLHNLILFFGIRDRSHLYYSLYLFSTVLAWLSVFSVLARHFNINEVGYSLLPFYFGQMFSILFFINFLNLKFETHPKLTFISYALVVVQALYIGVFPLIDSYYVYYKSLIIALSLWLSLTLFAGWYRLTEGFKPARFFLVGFSMVAVGGFVSLLPGMGINPGFDDFYLFTLVCQTLDMMFLAVALADRIALMRKDRETALRHAHERDIEILEVEQTANKALIESNLKLQEALDMSEEEAKKKQHFLMVASHELKTPLNALVQPVRELDSESDVIPLLRNGVERLALVVDEVTLFSQLITGEIKSVLTPVSVVNVMMEIKDIQSRLHEDVTIEVVCKADLSVLLDRYLFSMVARSLADNAAKYSKKNQVRITVVYDANGIKCVFEDDGEGMSPDDIENMLQPFEQKSQGYDRLNEGIGLGLYVVTQSLAVMGGTINIGRSHDLGGASVEICLPCELKKETSPVLRRLKRVLIVEDNRVNALVLKAILNKLKVDSVVCENGEEALSVARDDQFDLVYMDLQMPVMDGFEATAALIKMAYPAPIVAVTANSESSARERCLALGMVDVLVKPVKQTDIENNLAQLGFKVGESPQG